MFTVSADSLTNIFSATCSSLVEQGQPVAPRGLPTREILGAHLTLTAPRARFVDLPPARVLNPAFAAAEAVWILSGSDADWIFTYNQRLTRFADGGRLQGAYGPRLRRWRGQIDQLDAVRRTLERDGDTRQAVIQLFDPARDFSGYRDVPCTLGYRFYIRGGRLVMYTGMRSQDAWFGLPYDMFTTTVLQELLAGWLGVEIGDYHHVIDSLHLYQQHHEAAQALPTPPARLVMPPLTVAWDDLDALLVQVLAGEGVGHPGWDDIATVLGSYRSWKDGDRDTARAALADPQGPLTEALENWYRLLETAPHRLGMAPARPNRVRSAIG